MRELLTTVLLSLVHLTLLAQLGPCGDPLGVNYNPVSPQAGFDCTYPPTLLSPTTVCELLDVAETSGIISWNGKLFTHNDSGGEPELYQIDLTNGQNKQVVRLQGLTADSIGDWEALTQDENYIYIGDFGNNNGTRKNLRVYRISKSNITEEDSVFVPFEVIPFFYPEQVSFESSQSHNFDCEGFIAKDDTLWLFTKNRGNLNTSIYAVPAKPSQEPYAANLRSTYNSMGQITGASYDPQTGRVALIGYINLARPFVYLLWRFPNNDFFSGYVRRFELPDGLSGQCEAICFPNENEIYISNENLGVPARISVFEDRYTQPSLTGIHESFLQKEIAIRNGRISLKANYDLALRVIDLKGAEVLSGTISQADSLNIDGLKPGVYQLVWKEGEQRFTKKFLHQ
ncbi:MAG: hypothetical protein ACPF8V_01815 [Luteibaculum sp.]